MWSSILESTVCGGRTKSHSQYCHSRYKLRNLSSVLHKACHSDTLQTRDLLNTWMHNFMGITGTTRVSSKPIPTLFLNKGSFSDLKNSGIGRNQWWYNFILLNRKQAPGLAAWARHAEVTPIGRQQPPDRLLNGALARQSYISVNAPQ